MGVLISSPKDGIFLYMDKKCRCGKIIDLRSKHCRNCWNVGRKYPNRKLSKKHKANIASARKREWESGLRKRKWHLKPEQIEKARLTWIGRKHKLESREKMSLAKIGKYLGENHPNWQGGITKESFKIRNSREYKLWRKAVFERDNWTCMWCGLRSSKGLKAYLHADHIKPFAYFPELRFAIDNG